MKNVKEWTSISMPEPLTVSSRSKGWKRRFAYRYLTSPRRPSRSELRGSSKPQKKLQGSGGLNKSTGESLDRVQVRVSEQKCWLKYDKQYWLGCKPKQWQECEQMHCEGYELKHL